MDYMGPDTQKETESSWKASRRSPIAPFPELKLYISLGIGTCRVVLHAWVEAISSRIETYPVTC